MLFTGSGHPAIRATHAKTLELSLDADITERATCVVAVAAATEQLTPLAGPVHITLSAGGESFGFDALANSSWTPGATVVIRRSPLRLPGTLAAAATASAADLPIGLRAALRDPAASVVLEVQPSTGAPTVVLLAADAGRPDDPRLAAEVAAADTVVAEDAAARALVRRADRLPAQIDGRLLVVSTQRLPGAGLPSGVLDNLLDGVAVDVVGLPPSLAAVAAVPGDSVVVFAPADADPRRVLRDAPAAARVLLSADARRLPELFRLAREARGSARGALVRDTAPPIRTGAGDVPDAPELPGAGPTFLCLAPAPGDAPLDPRTRAAAVGLLADGVPAATAARALAAMTGWPRRQAYDAVLALRAQPRAGR